MVVNSFHSAIFLDFRLMKECMAILLLPASNLGMIVLGADEKDITLSDKSTQSGDKSK